MLDPSRARELLDYDSETGVLRWRITRFKAKAGRVAGYVKPDGYVGLMIDGRPYLAHRVAWLHVHGRWPDPFLDHINRDRSDNRLANLREATRHQNGWNRKVQSTSRTGVKGVSYDSSRDSYRATIRVNGRQKHIGNFPTIEQASAAYAKVAIELRGEFACVS